MKYVAKDVLIWEDVDLLTEDEKLELLEKIANKLKPWEYAVKVHDWINECLHDKENKYLTEYCRQSWENTFRVDSPCQNAPWYHKRIHVSGYWEDGGVNSGMIVDYSVYTFLAAVYTCVGDNRSIKIYEDKYGDFHIEAKQKEGTLTHHYTLRTEEENEPLHFFHYVYGWDGHWVTEPWLYIPGSSVSLHEEMLEVIKTMEDEFKIDEE